MLSCVPVTFLLTVQLCFVNYALATILLTVQHVEQAYPHALPVGLNFFDVTMSPSFGSLSPCFSQFVEI